MAFESLTDKLQNVFKNLRSKGRLTEEDVKSALKEVKMALLEADVNFKVVKQFVKAVEERAIGQDVMNGLNPGQMVIKIVNEEMVNLMGSETTEIAMQPGKAITVIMMAGLQGAGKTTATAKIAGKLKLKGKKPLLVACDIYRPAAIEQLQINGKKQEVDVFSMGTDHKPAEIAKEAIAYAEKNGRAVAAFVCPTLFPSSAPEAHTDGTGNLVTLFALRFGKQSFYGAGAGGYPTGSNVLRDCLDVADGCRSFYADSFTPCSVNLSGTQCKWLFRCMGEYFTRECSAREAFDAYESYRKDDPHALLARYAAEEE